MNKKRNTQPLDPCLENADGIVLCATRGSEASRNTEQQAIDLAIETGFTLIFIYIVDTHFLDKTAAPIVVDVDDELSDMGEFLLLMVKQRAEEYDVTVVTQLRKGEVREEIKNAAKEVSADFVVLGKPAGEGSTFQLSKLKEFAKQIEAESGAIVKIV